MKKEIMYYRIKNGKVEAWTDTMVTCCCFKSVNEMKTFFKGYKFTRLLKKDYIESGMVW